MPSVFNIVRLSIFSIVLAWTLIVLGLASHLETMLIANDLTRFIPLSIFISVCTLLVIPTLLISGFLRQRFAVQQVRVELGLVGLLGILWLVLGIYTAFEPDTQVECDFDGDDIWDESDEFSTDMYHAQYRTLEAFSIFNAILLIAYFFLLLLLSMKEQIQSRTHVWISEVVHYPWFGIGANDDGLPAPATSKDIYTPTISISALRGKKFQFGPKGEEMSEAQQPMKAGGHYIIYIPPPPPPPPSRGNGPPRGGNAPPPRTNGRK